MKILMTADVVGGVWTYAIELSRALLRDGGVEVALATQGAPLTPDQRAEARGVDGLELYESHFRLEWMPEPWSDVARAGEWLMELASGWRPDVIHLNDYARGALPLGAPALVVGHSCVSSWWEAVHRTGLPPGWERYRREVARGLHAAAAVVAPSRAMLSALQRHYGPLRRAQVIYNGRDAALFPPRLKEPFVLAAGRLWDLAKNAAALETIAHRLPWPVYLAGEEDGSGAASSVDRTPSGEPTGAVKLGRLPSARLAQWFSRAAIYALPARYEPFGLSALEAALAGCALVLGDIESLREIWGDAAVFVAPDDLDALEAALRRLMEPAERARWAARARARALGLAPGVMAAQYRALYAELAASPLAKEVPACAS